MLKLKNISKVISNNIDKSRLRAIIHMFLKVPVRFGALKKDQYCILKDVSLSVDYNDKVLILSISPKELYLLSRLMCRLTYPTAGKMNITGSTRRIAVDKLGNTPLMTIKEYVWMIGTIFTNDYSRLNQQLSAVLEDCGFKDQEQVKLSNCENAIIRDLTFYTCVSLDADVFIFDNMFTTGTGALREKSDAKVQEIFRTKTTVALTCSPETLPPCAFSKAIVIHDGKICYEGDAQTAIRGFNLLREFLSVEGNDNNGVPVSFQSLFDGNPVQHSTNTIEPIEHVAPMPPKAHELLQKIADSGQPIIVGPFLSEVSFELLYWIPFLRAIQKRYRIAPNRLVAVSRFGADGWYKDFCSEYVDVLDFYSSQEFKEKQEKRIETVGGIKQFTITDFEYEIIRNTAQKYDLDAYQYISPALMYNLFRPSWKNIVPLDTMFQLLEYGSFPQPRTNKAPFLPDEYIAFRFDFNPFFPDTEETRNFIKNILSAVAEWCTVVVLNAHDSPEFYAEIKRELKEKLFLCQNLGDNRESYTIQTHIISHAKTFIGSWISESFIAPFCHTKTIGLLDKTIGNYPSHLETSRYLFKSLPENSFVLLKISDAVPEQIMR
ncbi:hypothetical protein KDK77_00880, partial [bacterium]|nr:hypothetical protein [bacterium]